MLVAARLLVASQAMAQTATNSLPPAASNDPIVTTDKSAVPWSFSVSAYTYLVPDSREYVQPSITADRRWLHLEARYNYEDLETGSVWAGYNFSGGEKLAWEFTPMLGAVFGNTTGVAPGYKGSLSWWKLELYSVG
jgi:hypothetical protein